MENFKHHLICTLKKYYVASLEYLSSVSNEESDYDFDAYVVNWISY